MLKFLTPLALAALTAISIAPQAQAFPINIDSISIGQSSRSNQPRIVVKIGGQPEYSNRWKSHYRHRESDRRRYDPYSYPDRYSEGRGNYYRNR
ncbi:hypothetical protein [Chamaesiphon sp.]|uniref:hypothetical protein n=1 Tax=Chamaesiphon sp. TaxID=2814140 RepID=UPI003594332F